MNFFAKQQMASKARTFPREHTASLSLSQAPPPIEMPPTEAPPQEQSFDLSKYLMLIRAIMERTLSDEEDRELRQIIEPVGWTHCDVIQHMTILELHDDLPEESRWKAILERAFVLPPRRTSAGRYVYPDLAAGASR